MRFFLFLALLGMGLSAPVAAQTFRPAPLFDPATISLRVLPNGVRGVVKETRGTGVVAVQVWVRAGGRYETENSSGASHLIENLALRSSRNYPGASGGATDGGARDALEGLGGVVTSETTRDATFYGAVVGAGFLPAAVRALSDAALRPTLTDPAVADAKIEVENELERRGSDPVTAAAQLAYRTAFAKHPYGRPAVGSPESVEALSASTVRAFYRARYAGANISVIVVGDVRREAAHQLIERAFNVAPAGTGSTPRVDPERGIRAPQQAQVRRATLFSTVALAWNSPGITQPDDVVAMDVLLALWKEGPDAALRPLLLGPETEESENAPPADAPPSDNPLPANALAIAYDVDFLTQRDPGLFLVSMLTVPDRRGSAVRAVLNEVGRVRREGVSAAAMARAQESLRRQYVAQGETPAGQAGALGFYEMIDTYQFAASYLDRVARVTPNDVKRVANKYLSETAYVQAAIEPRDPDAAPRPRRPRDDENIITAALPQTSSAWR